MKQVLKKLMSRTLDHHNSVEINRETFVYERIEKELLTESEITELIDHESDAESAYFTYGLQIGWDDDLVGITLDTLAEGLENYLKDEDEVDYQSLREIRKKIEPWRAYELEFEAEKPVQTEGRK